ncbi:MAG TPA: fatty acyl-AMP ligase, partial [Caulobacteraceae bacterium]|nr:fatty acyl-AMP ligase [Caulobacteraceae bacterium]
TPTPTAPERKIRIGDFPTVAAALDHAAGPSTGINFHSVRGELTEVLPYPLLQTQARALAGRMLAAGLAPGDRVALAAESDGDFVRAFFACQYAGLAPAPLPLPAPFGGKEAYVAHVRRMLISSGARAALAPPALAEWFAEAGEGLGLIAARSLEELPADRASDLPTPDEAGLCYLQFSSGSTRFPLGVAVTQKALMANARGIARDALNVTPEDRGCSWLPLYHDMGLVGILMTSLICQASLDLLPTGAFVRRPSLWLDMISKRRGTVSYAPTFGYELAARRAGASALQDLDLSCWRVAGLGGDMIRAEPLRAFAEAYAPAGFNAGAYLASYGMAEATLALTFSRVGGGLRTDEADIDRLERDGRAAKPHGSGRSREFALCGEALPGHRLEVRDEAGRVVGERQVGRIFAAGPSLMQTYFGEPEETAKVLSADGWLDTGDLGYLLDGQIVITGRAKDLIIVNGRNVWPQDLEWTAESEAPGLRSGDVAVFSVAGEQEEAVVALVQTRTSDPAARQTLRNEVASLIRLRHGLEAQVVLTPPHSLPQTSSGKLSRARARALFLSGAFDTAAVSVTA